MGRRKNGGGGWGIGRKVKKVTSTLSIWEGTREGQGEESVNKKKEGRGLRLIFTQLKGRRGETAYVRSRPFARKKCDSLVVK